MRPFEYIRPGTLAEAIAALAQHGADARVIAGGTDVLIELRRPNARTPKVIVDISGLKDLRGIASEGGSLVVRPLTTHAVIVESKLLRELAPLLSTSASTIGSPQIRNRGTVGGNIMNAAPCADTVPPLVALVASVKLESQKGSRTVSIAELFERPYRTTARPDELLTEIRFSKLPKDARSVFIKLGRRNAVSISRLSVAVTLLRDEDRTIVDARIAPGSAFATWKRVTEAEKMLIGERSSRELFTAAGRKVSEVMVAETGRRWSTEYKEPVLAILVRRALESCV